jgi:hypothetical protein
MINVCTNQPKGACLHILISQQCLLLAPLRLILASANLLRLLKGLDKLLRFANLAIHRLLLCLEQHIPP